ncbi:MAG: hypothetical protein A2X94_07190 [Bdellovibrionales bacterium GWB1_55_8]|nr:MAG: hypothetical protein A2X94_07190 [Bdellovibrionales bacterium GWB1_55_8]
MKTLLMMVVLVTSNAAFAQDRVLLDCNNGALTVHETRESRGNVAFSLIVHDQGVIDYLQSRGIKGNGLRDDGSLEFAGGFYRSEGLLQVRTYFKTYTLVRKGMGARLGLVEEPSHGGLAFAEWYFESCVGEL